MSKYLPILMQHLIDASVITKSTGDNKTVKFKRYSNLKEEDEKS
jgi:hypothetical protein